LILDGKVKKPEEQQLKITKEFLEEE